MGRAVSARLRQESQLLSPKLQIFLLKFSNQQPGTQIRPTDVLFEASLVFLIFWKRTANI